MPMCVEATKNDHIGCGCVQGKSSYVKVRNTVCLIQLVQLCEFQTPLFFFFFLQLLK